MGVRLRLARMGRKKRPTYRIVAADSRAPRDGRFIEQLGAYNPIPNQAGIKELQVNLERVRYWISVGAQPSDRVAWLLAQAGELPPRPVPHRPKRSVPRAERGLHTAAFAHVSGVMASAASVSGGSGWSGVSGVSDVSGVSGVSGGL